VASEAYARIKADVLAIVSTVPAGRVATYREIGRWLDVMPRHVAYLLGRLNPKEADAVPWHRVVGDGGWLGAPKEDGLGRTQAERLAEEGVAVVDGRVSDFEVVAVNVGELGHDVPRGEAPPGAAGWKGVA
jgi:methylated-DNA-protein-cysteine methyltransferase-like protein